MTDENDVVSAILRNLFAVGREIASQEKTKALKDENYGSAVIFGIVEGAFSGASESQGAPENKIQ
jgi:hypothetical protein